MDKEGITFNINKIKKRLSFFNFPRATTLNLIKNDITAAILVFQNREAAGHVGVPNQSSGR